jgi:predicted nucleotidyltransferase
MAEKEKSEKSGGVDSKAEEEGYSKQMEKQVPDEVKKEIERIQKNLGEFKKTILKKFPFVEAIGIIPPQASPLVEEEEEVEKEKDEKLIHVLMVVSEEKAKKIPELKVESIKLVQHLKPRVWLHIKSAPELWEMCFDGKYPLIEAISMAFPLHDKGILGALRLASVHKSLILKKFERYVVSYILAGSLVRGDTTKSSDVDVYIVIDDTDIKRMGRYELKEKLRAIIYSYAMEAGDISGVKNKLNPQIYILTEFWEAVKDAHPVIFTFIRDGVPLYDRGAFMPWKLLLKMGKIKPSPEAIDMFMSLGERVAEIVKRKLNDIVTEDIYWGVITPSQAMLMLYGMPPPTPKEIQQGIFRKIFVEKEKLLESKYADILEKIVGIYKKYEHEEIKTITGKEIDELVQQSSEYIERLKKLMHQIEQKAAEREVVQLYDSVFDMIGNMFGKAGEAALIKKLEELAKKAKIASRNVTLLNKICEMKKKHAKGKITRHDIAEMHRASYELTNALLEYIRRQELLEIEKRKISIVYKTKEGGKEIVKKGEIVLFREAAFVIPDITADSVKKWQGNKIHESSREELKQSLAKREVAENKITPELLAAIKKLVGEFELIF